MTVDSVKQSENNKKRRGFQPGISGNPKGRPKKGSAIADILNAIGDKTDAGKTKRELMLNKVYELALKGTPWAVEFIADRTEGRALERVATSQVEPREIIIE